MREIKFRAWDKRNCKIIQVSALRLDPQSGWSNGECGLHIGLAETDYNLMQYTGLKDKKGKEIYEGDIVSFNGVIARICITDLIDGDNFWDAHQVRESEIIGNQYEDPELLKETK